MERDVGEHIDGRLEHIEAFVCSHMVKTVAGIAALHIEPEGFSVAVGTPFVGVTRDAFLICAHKYCIVVFRIFVQEPFPGEVGYHTSVNVPMLHQIGIDPAHIGVDRRQDKGLWRLHHPLCGRGVDGTHFSAQQHGHRFGIAEVVEALHKADGVTAPLLGMVVPLVSADGDAVVLGSRFSLPDGISFSPRNRRNSSKSTAAARCLCSSVK